MAAATRTTAEPTTTTARTTSRPINQPTTASTTSTRSTRSTPSTTSTRAATTSTTSARAKTQATPTTESTTAAAASSSSSASSASSATGSAASDASSSNSSSGGSSSSNAGTIAGVVVVLAVVAIAGVVGFFWWRRKKRNQRNIADGSAPFDGSNHTPVVGAGAGYAKQDEDFYGNNGYGSHDAPSAYNPSQQQRHLSHGSWVSGGNNGYGSMNAMPAAAVAGGAQLWDEKRGAYGNGATSPFGDEHAARNDAPLPPPPQMSTYDPHHQSWASGGGPGSIHSSHSYGPDAGFQDTNPSSYPPPPATESSRSSQGVGAYGAPAMGAAAGAAAVAAAAYGAGPRESVEQPPQQQPVDDAMAAGASPFGPEQPGQGKVHIVQRTFEPSLSDELHISPGDRIQVLVAYDDGWALGINLDSNSTTKGCVEEPLPQLSCACADKHVFATHSVFPLDCVDPTPLGEAPVMRVDPSEQPGEMRPEQYPLPPSNAGTPVPPSPVKSTGSGPAPSLPPLRSDSPLHASFAAASAGTQAPVLQVSSASTQSHLNSLAAAPPHMDEHAGPLATAEPEQPQDARRLSTAGAKVKRTSSLIASRDADLFVALGDVLNGRSELEQRQQPPQQH